MSVRLAVLIVLLVSILASAQTISAQVTTSTSVTNGNGRPFATSSGGTTPRFAPDRVLVKFRNGAPRAFLPGSGAANAFPRDPNLFLVNNPPGLAVADAVARYKANTNVEYAEPDYQVQLVDTPNDALWSTTNTWDMIKISAPTVWTLPPPTSGVVVAIIDTGIDYTHEDLQGNLWLNSDGSHGFTCIGGSCVAGGLDDYGHGTHVAGTIGGVGNNGKGIAGLNWNIQLLSLKFLDSNGSGNISDAVVAFQEVLYLKQTKHVNIVLTSNSWGGGGYSQALKDAMSAVEAAGILDVCAAGNSAVNADLNPMYPAAYDNRGIISVLATDNNDAGASFTNYGLASVDIAAPGVNTLSTSPIGTCSLCTPAVPPLPSGVPAPGYRFLSGTSMATPHVSGVAAGLLAGHSSLSPAEARDIILDPGSYVAMTDPRARSTSTGGRLDYNLALQNSRLKAPIVLNNFPILTLGPDVTVNAAQMITLSPTATDLDGDTLRFATGKSVSTATQWLLGWNLNLGFPDTGGPAPSLSRVATVPYYAEVADNHGGGASGVSNVTVNPDSTKTFHPPSGTLSVSNPAPATVPSTITVNVPVTDPNGLIPYWDLWAAGMNGSNGWCCYSGSSINLTFNSAGVFRIRSQAMDPALNTFSGDGVVVKVGGATGEPPIARATFDRLSGPAPLTVHVDMSGSSDADGFVQWYYFLCSNGFAAGQTSPLGTCTFTQPGSYWVELQIQDNSGQVDLISAYVVATPPTGTTDTTAPTVSIATPSNNTNVSGTVTLTANASDNSGTVSKVDYRLDSPAGTSIGTSSTGPTYSVNWDTAKVAFGSHILYAIATDAANNSSTSAPVTVNVTAVVLPIVSISPANGTAVSVKSNVNIAVTVMNAPTNGTSRVDISVNNSLVCSDTSAPYSCAWKVPAAPGKTYTISATGYDGTGIAGPKTSITVTSK